MTETRRACRAVRLRRPGGGAMERRVRASDVRQGPAVTGRGEQAVEPLGMARCRARRCRHHRPGPAASGLGMYLKGDPEGDQKYPIDVERSRRAIISYQRGVIVASNLFPKHRELLVIDHPSNSIAGHADSNADRAYRHLQVKHQHGPTYAASLPYSPTRIFRKSNDAAEVPFSPVVNFSLLHQTIGLRICARSCRSSHLSSPWYAASSHRPCPEQTPHQSVDNRTIGPTPEHLIRLQHWVTDDRTLIIHRQHP